MRRSVSKVGIIGFKGFVGSAFFEVFSSDKKYEVLGIEKGNSRAFCSTSVDLLINADGNSSKLLADKNPALDFEMNAANTLRFLHDFPCEHYVHISTVEVYPDRSSPEKTHEDCKIDHSKLSNYGSSKYLSEQIAKKFSKSHLILRLAGMVGKGMKKGPAYDMLSLQKLFVSPKCKYHYMDTADVAKIAKTLCEMGRWNETYNVVGRGNIELSEFAKLAGIKLTETGTAISVLNVSTSKLEKELAVPETPSTVKNFISSWKAQK